MWLAISPSSSTALGFLICLLQSFQSHLSSPSKVPYVPKVLIRDTSRTFYTHLHFKTLAQSFPGLHSHLSCFIYPSQAWEFFRVFSNPPPSIPSRQKSLSSFWFRPSTDLTAFHTGAVCLSSGLCTAQGQRMILSFLCVSKYVTGIYKWQVGGSQRLHHTLSLAGASQGLCDVRQGWADVGLCNIPSIKIPLA